MEEIITLMKELISLCDERETINAQIEEKLLKLKNELINDETQVLYHVKQGMIIELISLLNNGEPVPEKTVCCFFKDKFGMSKDETMEHINTLLSKGRIYCPTHGNYKTA